MKNKRLTIHLLSIGILAAGLGLSVLIQPEPGGYVRMAIGIAGVAFVFLLVSFLMNGKLVPLFTALGYSLTFLFAFFFQIFNKGVGTVFLKLKAEFPLPHVFKIMCIRISQKLFAFKKIII